MPPVDDLMVVVADADAHAAMESLLRRRLPSLEIREISFTIRRFVKRDPGCYLEAHEFLRPFIQQYSYALVLFDQHGCGAEIQPRAKLEQEVEERLARNGWKSRAAAVVIEPELEAWVWSTSPEVDYVLGWKGRRPTLRDWLVIQEYLVAGEIKPADPKSAMLGALREAARAKSSYLFGQLADRVSLASCQDAGFDKLRRVLQSWFPPFDPRMP